MKRWIGTLLVLGLGVRVVLAWLPIETLLARTLPDDAFIYFVIARNLAAGLGATFDGVQPTNGFHPLWTLSIVPIFAVFSAGDLPVHLALTLGAMCDCLAGGVAAWAVWRVSRSQLATLLSLGFYLFNPRLIQESVNGLETGLALLCLSVCLAAWIGWQENLDQKKRSVFFGLMAGLAFLARSDLAVIVGLLWLAVVIKLRLRNVTAILSLLAAVLVVVPWLFWSQVNVGTLIQSSGVAIPSLVAARIQSSTDFVAVWNVLLFPILNLSLRNSLIYPGVAILASIFGLVFVRWSKSTLESQPTWMRSMTTFVLPLVGALLILAVHTVVRWYPRGWYFAPLAWAGAMFSGPVLAVGLTSPLGRRFGRWVLVLLLIITLSQSIKMLGEPEYQSQSDMRAGAEWLAANTTTADTIGAFNAGIYAYYSERRVLSLDGLVDWGAIEARQQNRLLDYFLERGGTLIIDHRDYVKSFTPFFGSHSLEATQTLPVSDLAYGPIEVYIVR